VRKSRPHRSFDTICCWSRLFSSLASIHVRFGTTKRSALRDAQFLRSFFTVLERGRGVVSEPIWPVGTATAAYVAGRTQGQNDHHSGPRPTVRGKADIPIMARLMPYGYRA